MNFATGYGPAQTIPNLLQNKNYINMSNIKKALGKIVIVNHIENIKESSIIEIPETAKNQIHTKLVTAEVLTVGSKSCWLSELIPGDKVLVPFHLGTKVKDNIIYDDEDVYAKIY